METGEEAIKMKPLFIETKRLQIKEWSEELADAVYTISQDESNRQYLPDEVFESADEAQEWLRELLNNRETGEGSQVFPVFLKTGKLIGHVGICPLEDWDEKAWEIEYHISEARRGQGYAVETVNAFVPIIMERFHLHNLRGFCPQEHTASVRVMERCGFHKYREKDVRYYGKPTRLLYYIYEE